MLSQSRLGVEEACHVAEVAAYPGEKLGWRCPRVGGCQVVDGEFQPLKRLGADVAGCGPAVEFKGVDLVVFRVGVAESVRMRGEVGEFPGRVERVVYRFGELRRYRLMPVDDLRQVALVVVHDFRDRPQRHPALIHERPHSFAEGCHCRPVVDCVDLVDRHSVTGQRLPR
jgi:hypothetical protein